MLLHAVQPLAISGRVSDAQPATHTTSSIKGSGNCSVEFLPVRWEWVRERERELFRSLSLHRWKNILLSVAMHWNSGWSVDISSYITLEARATVIPDSGITNRQVNVVPSRHSKALIEANVWPRYVKRALVYSNSGSAILNGPILFNGTIPNEPRICGNIKH